MHTSTRLPLPIALAPFLQAPVLVDPAAPASRTRTPVERFATAMAQYRGAWDAALGRPARKIRGI